MAQLVRVTGTIGRGRKKSHSLGGDGKLSTTGNYEARKRCKITGRFYLQQIDMAAENRPENDENHTSQTSETY